jgi:hypothetical protein
LKLSRAALGIPVEIVREFAVELGKEAIVKVGEMFGRDDDEGDPVPCEPAFKALDTVDGIPEQVLRGLRAAWIRPLGAEVIATCSFVADTQRRLYEVLSAGAGTSWFSGGTRGHCEALLRDLGGLEHLIDQPQPDRAEIVKVLGTLAADIPTLKAQLRHDVAPLEPDQERQAAIDALNKLIAELNEDINTSDQETARVKRMLRLNPQARKHRIRIRRFPGDADAAPPNETSAPLGADDTSK